MRAAAILTCLLLAGCGGGRKEAEKPAPKKTSERAPETYRVLLETSKGPVVIAVTRAWAPRGADRFYQLVESGFYDGARFFRVVRNFVAQFGLSGRPEIDRLWSSMRFPDDSVQQSNKKGYVSFAMAGPESRTTQVFINLKDNTPLDARGFAPFGEVAEGLENVERLYLAYGDGPPRGAGPDQDEIRRRGNAYLEERFPRLDYIRKASIQP